MAFYTPPSLPRTPAYYTMNATLPSLPTELLSWSLWRNNTKQTPLTPPMTSTFQTRRTHQPQPRVKTTLPSIAHLERHLAPLTPPDDVGPIKHSPPAARLPPIVNQTAERATLDCFQPKLPQPSDLPYMDWLDLSRTRSSHFLAEKTCEMICYLWFATSSPEHTYATPNNSPPFLNRPNPSTTTLQLVATPTFVQFMQKLLETTQVSQSVIVLSLHYIYRLKDRNRFTPAQPGSEFRIAVAGLMMANKFLDDNTYTNKTWSEVSGIDLSEINRMEREFLMGVDFNLYVDKATYESWLNLLKGLVMAKERDSRHFRKSRGLVRASRLTHPPASSGPASRTYMSKYRTTSNRARSTSPSQTRGSAPYSTLSHGHPANTEPSSPTPRSGSKRSAAAAFSPTSATFSHLPSKRPVSISLQIPEYGPANNGPHSHSPLEGLQSFATMSLASPHPRPPSQSVPRPSPSHWTSGPRQAPETLVAPYSQDEERRKAVPQNLYFYTLACSPTRDEESRSRKAKLRYHQPPPPSTAPYYHPQPSVPVIQSASTSPHEHHMHVTSHYSLPHFHDTQWSRPPNTSLPSFEPLPPLRYTSTQTVTTESPVPSAPFANAGPPGVHFYPTPVQTSSVYPPNWATRERRF
ncbi:Cyclin-U4-3 [Hypsizygus marmoreus]|uniref:Cyclin-U4-3 n=1 Tax=Hypsizygus marmoreus TaxID=39966 RepID=A0A369JZX5_HYPMA|nr:Cyclin-U4-3 [Hypsizygus marmoreus]